MSKLRTVAALLALLAGRAAAADKAPRRPNIVLVVVDALRADHLTPYGYARDTSPRLAAFAREGVLFSHASAASNWTLPALSSLMTGLYPTAHGAVRGPQLEDWPRALEKGLYTPQPRGRLDPARRTLARALSERGYRTVGLVSGGLCRSAFGFANGFDEYYDGGGSFAGDLMPKVLAELDRERDRPFFLYIHDPDVHDPYGRGAEFDRMWDPDYSGKIDGSRESLSAIARGRLKVSERDLRHLAALYDGGIAYADRQLGALLDALDARGLSSTTLVVVTADHGEAFEEHGSLIHGEGLYEELLRIPLIVRLPGGARGRRVDVPVSQVDIFPTLAAAAGAKAPREAQGRSLLAALEGGALPQADVFAEEHGKADGYSVRRGGWKYIALPGDERLFDLSADPGEKVDLREREPAKARELSAALAAWRASSLELARRLPTTPYVAGKIDATLRDKLRAEGYIP